MTDPVPFDDRPLIAREAACAILDGGRTHGEALDYFGVSAFELAQALIAEAEARKRKRDRLHGGGR